MKTSESNSWLGFDSRFGRLLGGDPVPALGLIAPGSRFEISSRVQVPFRGERLFVHSPIASSFLILSLCVGRQEQTVASVPIPADAFATRMDALSVIEALYERDKVVEIKIDKIAAELLGSPWTLPKAFAGTEIAFVVENLGNVPLRFLAGFLGKTDW
jgi:hypothetical protein